MTRWTEQQFTKFIQRMDKLDEKPEEGLVRVIIYPRREISPLTKVVRDKKSRR